MTRTTPAAIVFGLAIAASSRAGDHRIDGGAAALHPRALQTVGAVTCPSSPLAPPAPCDTTFVADCADDLDTVCTFADEVPGGALVVPIAVTRAVGDLRKLIASGRISDTATISLPAFDVDYFGGDSTVAPERDAVFFNDHPVADTYLTGDDEVWKLNQFRVPIDEVLFALPVAAGPPTPRTNVLRIQIDTQNAAALETWCTAVDWVAISFEVAPPVVFVHGIFSNGDAWDKSPFSWVQTLFDEGVPYSNALSMGPLDSIQNNAVRIANEVGAVKTRYGVDRVTLVTHSKGGLDSRHYVEHHDDVDRLIQLGTPNAGSPLADYLEAGAVLLLDPEGAELVNEVLGGPAGFQLTRPYMALYNALHGHNPDVAYTALAGVYDPACFFCWERPLAALVGEGDLVVPKSSVHALSYMDHLKLDSAGSDRQAIHTNLNASPAVFAKVRDVVLAPRSSSAPITLTAASDRTRSIVGTIAQSAVETAPLAVETSVPLDVVLAFPSGDLDLALISPTGQRIDAASAPGIPGVSVRSTDLFGGHVEVASVVVPEVGVWTVEVSAPSVDAPSGHVPYVVTGLLTGATATLTASLSEPSIAPGGLLRIAATFADAGAPVLDAAIEAIVALPDGSRDTVALHDDGVYPDAVALDGDYAGVLADTGEPGTYRIVVQAARSAPPTTRETFLLATVSHGPSTIAGTFRDAGVDADFDGLFDRLDVEVDLDVGHAGTFELLAVLTDDAGHAQDVHVTAALPSGPQTVTVSFDGRTIFDRRSDGPYHLSVVRLAEADGDEIHPVDERTDAYDTAAYAYTDFEHPDLFLTANGYAVGSFLDGDALFDALDVGIEVETAVDGVYEWSARLTDADDNELGFAAGSGYFDVGLDEITLSFEVGGIAARCANGPYFIRGLLLFGPGGSLVVPDALTTPAFLARDFAGSAACGTAELAIEKTASADEVAVGDDVTFTISIRNDGPADDADVVVTDPLPSSLTLVSAPSGCTFASATLTCDVGSLAAGAVASFDVVTRPTVAGIVANTASVAGAQGDDDPSDDASTASIMVSPASASTSTTLPSACASEATFSAIRCRLAALESRTDAAVPSGKLARKLDATLASGRRLVARAQAALSKARRSRKLVGRAAAALQRFVRLLGSPRARRTLDEALRAALIADASGIASDVVGVATP